MTEVLGNDSPLEAKIYKWVAVFLQG